MMNDMRILLLAAAFLSPSGIAQDPGQPLPPNVQVAPAGIQEWIQQLGSDKYRERLDAENKLRAQGKAAKGALEAAAADESDSEVQWRAKRLLRQLGGAGQQRVDGSKPQPARPGLVERSRSRRDQDPKSTDVQLRRASVDDVRVEFDRLFRELEQQHGIDVPRFRFFDDDFFKDIRSQVGQSHSQGTSVQITPGGVRVEVSETNEAGEADTKVYEAPDMETFRKKYPDVLKDGVKIGFNLKGMGLPSLPDDFLGGGRIQLGEPVRGFDWKMLRPRVVPFEKALRPPPVGQPTPPGAAEAVPPKGRRLGVMIQDLPDALRDYLELAPGVGLMIESVQRGTLAASLRLRAGDIVVGISGKKIGSPSDVRDALSLIKKGDDVEVAFIRRGERREASTKKVETAQADREQLQPKKAGSSEKIR